jgi:hypothetical protein
VVVTEVFQHSVLDEGGVEQDVAGFGKFRSPRRSALRPVFSAMFFYSVGETTHTSVNICLFFSALETLTVKVGDGCIKIITACGA